MTIREDPSIPIAIDAACLLFLVAIQDEAINGINTTYDFANISPNSFDAEGVLRLQVKPSKADTLVLRRIEWDEERNVWAKDPLLGQTAMIFAYQLRHTSKYASLSGLRLKDIRRMACNAMNDPRLPETEAQAVVGHLRGTDTYRKRYISKHSTVNLQALICHGTTPEALAPVPLRRFPKTAYLELDDQEEATLTEDAQVRRARLLHIHLSEELQQRYGSVAKARAVSAEQDAETAAKVAKLDKAKIEANIVLRNLRHHAMLQKGRKSQVPVIQEGPAAMLSEMQEEQELHTFERVLLHQSTPSRLAAWLKPQTEGQDHLALAVCSSFAALLAGINNSAAHTAVFDRLFAADCNDNTERPSLSEAEMILSQVAGTQTKHWRSRCPGCKKTPPGASYKLQWSHVKTCVADFLREQASLSFASLVQGEQCPWPHCDYDFASVLEPGASGAAEDSDLITDPAAHLDGHLRRPQLTCPVKLANGEFCAFELSARQIKELTFDAERAEMLFHFEAVHGWPLLTVECCHDHDSWLLGTASIEQHFASDIEILLESESHLEHYCELCLHDETLRPSRRAKRYEFPKLVATHVANCHVAPAQSEVIKCGICSEECAALDWADHLIAEHRLALCGTDKQGGRKRFLDDPFSLHCTHAEERSKYLSTLGLLEPSKSSANTLKLCAPKIKNRQTLEEFAQRIGVPLDASPAEQKAYLDRKKQERKTEDAAKASALKAQRAIEAATRQQAEQEKRDRNEFRRQQTAAAKLSKSDPDYYKDRYDSMPLEKKQALLNDNKRKRQERTAEQVENDGKKVEN